MSFNQSADAAFRLLRRGDRFPHLAQACGETQRFAFDCMAGRYQLYGFFLSLNIEGSKEGIAAIAARRDLFDDQHCAYIGVTGRAIDRDVHGLRDRTPGMRFAWDFDQSMSRACGATPIDRPASGPIPVRQVWVLVDPSMHILDVFLMEDTPIETVIAAVAALPPPDLFGGILRPAPVLVLPNVFTPDLCRGLIGYFEAEGGAESGVHRDHRGVLDARFKRRKDCTVEDMALLEAAHGAIGKRVLPEIERLFFMKPCYIERSIVGRYAAADGGHFAAHFDNGGGATAHRRFAVSINLNDDFEGGEVAFPEFNTRGYKAPAGWAIVFPCGALHAVRPVTRGQRYAFLPFLYDEGGRQIREAAAAASRSAS